MNRITQHSDGACWFVCPGCSRWHRISTRDANPYSKYVNNYVNCSNPNWTFNGDLEKPTFSPSLRCSWHEGEERKLCVCHSYIRDGKIEFLGDCTHFLAGKTVDLKEEDLAL